MRRTLRISDRGAGSTVQSVTYPLPMSSLAKAGVKGGPRADCHGETSVLGGGG